MAAYEVNENAMNITYDIPVIQELEQIVQILRTLQWLFTNIPKWLFLVCFIFPLASLFDTVTGGESITVELARKPVLFGHNVVLVCIIQTADTPGHMAWIKIPNGETLALNNKTSNDSKYNIDMKYESSTMNYSLTIKKFAQSDVNCYYRCDSGFLSQYENLQLNKEDYIAMPGENEIERNASLIGGYLEVIIQVNSVFPELYNCTAMFEGDDITSQLKISNTTLDSIFYNMVIEISHQTVKCKGMINVTCSVSIRRIKLMEKDLDECSIQMQDTWMSLLILGPVLSSVIVMLLVCLFYIVCFLRRRRIKKEKKQHFIGTKKDQFNLKIQNIEQGDDELSSEESNTL